MRHIASLRGVVDLRWLSDDNVLPTEKHSEATTNGQGLPTAERTAGQHGSLRQILGYDEAYPRRR